MCYNYCCVITPLANNQKLISDNNRKESYPLMPLPCFAIMCVCQHTAYIACCYSLKAMPSTVNSRRHTSKALPSSRDTHLSSSTQVSKATHRSSRVTVSYRAFNKGAFFSCRRHCQLSLAPFYSAEE